MSYGTDKWAEWVIKEEEALPLLKAAWDAGIQTWDTADVYSNVRPPIKSLANTKGVSEVIVGKAIKKYKIPREKLVILTKCHGLVNDDPEGGPVFDPANHNKKEYVNKHGALRSPAPINCRIEPQAHL
jgi:aryl-alcohol dehydrogenase-like predicted oxidoreductase